MGQGDPFSLQLEKLNGGKRTIVFEFSSSLSSARSVFECRSLSSTRLVRQTINLYDPQRKQYAALPFPCAPQCVCVCV